MIAEVVTKGLDKTVPMKPSGVPWLGDVPAHWNIVAMGKRIEDCFNGTTSEQFPESNKLSMVTRIETISEGFVNYEYVGYVEHTEHLNRYQLKAGDILFSHINSLAMVGNCARYLGERPLYLGMNLLCLRPGSLIRSDYLYWTIRSFGFRKSVEKMAKPAINQASIPMSSLKRLMLISPPLVEQQAIADYLDTETAKIDALIAHAKDDIVLLKELRAATIADAVLGRIDVRTH
jgi:type I restriction enzyme S subunit